MSQVEQKLAVIQALIDSKKNIKPVKDNTLDVRRMAEQAIASMRDSVNNNQVIMSEIINTLSMRPKEFIIVRDNNKDMVKIIPVYENSK
jgi:hypothetical protein